MPLNVMLFKHKRNPFFSAGSFFFYAKNFVLYSMKIKEQTRKLAAGCSKQCFEVVDRTDEVSNHTYGKATLTWFEFDFRRVLGFFTNN